MTRRRQSDPPARILIVDDEPVVVEFAQRVLQSAGYRTMTATSGDEALKLCTDQGIPDLLVTDMKMPRMEGDELATRLRQREPDLKVLYLTGFADLLFKNKELLWDGEAYLEKPCTIGGLLEAVSLLLSGQISSDPLDT
ncbi:MAG TPA: response regulator [Vicinamibacterales bacterium]|nr:response regulator [Vicinamibacterales bacterium]